MPMDRIAQLTADIERDADVHSISRSSQLSHTLVGLGTLSGRAIMTVGEFAVRGVETVNIHIRLRTIATRLRQGNDVSHQMLVDLLELQRVGLYSRNVRRKALSTLLIAMGRPDCSQEIKEIMLAWPAIEIQLFVRQWAIFMLEIRTSNEWLSYGGFEMSDVFQDILQAVLKDNHQLIHEIFDVQYFVLLLSNARTTDSSDEDTLLSFIAQWMLSHHPDALVTTTQLFLDTGTVDERLTFIDIFMQAFRTFTGHYRDFMPLPRVSELALRNTVIPAGATLQLVIQLIATDQVLMAAFINAGLVHHIRDLYAAAFRAYGGADIHGDPRADELVVDYGMVRPDYEAFLSLYRVTPGIAGRLRMLDSALYFQLLVTGIIGRRWYQQEWFVSEMQEHFVDCMIDFLGGRTYAYSNNTRNMAWHVVVAIITHGSIDSMVLDLLDHEDTTQYNCCGPFLRHFFIWKATSRRQLFHGTTSPEYCFGVLVRALLAERPSAVASVLTVDELALAMVYRRGDDKIQDGDQEPLALFFQQLGRFLDKASQMSSEGLQEWTLPLVRYLQCASRDQLLTATAYILDSIQSSILLTDAVKCEGVARGVLPHLLFTFHLVQQDKDAAQFLLDGNMVDHLAEICKHSLTSGAIPENSWLGICQTLAVLIVDALCAHPILHSQIFSSASIEVFVRPKFSEQSAQAGGIKVLPESIHYHRLVIAYLNHLVFSSTKKDLDEEYLLEAFDLLRYPQTSCLLWPPANGPEQLAMTILLCYATLISSERRNAIASRILAIEGHKLFYLIDVIRQFIVSLVDPTKFKWSTQWLEAWRRGFFRNKAHNPVDRLLQLVERVAVQDQGVRPLFNLGMDAVIGLTAEGQFDACFRFSPTTKYLKARSRMCSSLQAMIDKQEKPQWSPHPTP